MLEPIRQYDTVGNSVRLNRMSRKKVEIHLEWINNQLQMNREGDDDHRWLLSKKNMNRKLVLSRGSRRNRVLGDENVNNQNVCKIGKLEGVKKQSLDRKESMVRDNMNRKKSLRSEENLKIVENRRDSCEVLIITPKSKGKMNVQVQNVKLKPIQNRIILGKRKVVCMMNECLNSEQNVLCPWELYKEKQANGEVDIVDYKIL